MSLPRIIVTGASGFMGRHLLEEIKESYQIIGIGRRSQHSSGAPVHANIRWHQVDIGDVEALTRIFAQIKDGGGAEALVHLAAHYDFTGDEHPEYWRTNVHGLRHVLDLSVDLGLKRFFFASSVAACQFPHPGETLSEVSIPDGDHIYARTKRIGEEMLQEYSGRFPTAIVRFAALFSDWCEYPPLFMFLETWLSRRWNARMLGGRGESAIPYMHVRDAATFWKRALEKRDDLESGEVLVSSTNGAVSHRELFAAATMTAYGRRVRPFMIPKAFAGPGMWVRALVGDLLGDPPFERPWMARYIDLAMTVVSNHTRQRLGWTPRPRLEVVRRLPFLLENRHTDPNTWNTLNRAAMKDVHLRPNLRVHRLLELHEEALTRLFTQRLLSPELALFLPNYQQVPRQEHAWNHKLAIRSLMNAVRTREKAVFMTYCRDLAERRCSQGFRVEEVCIALVSLNEVCLETIGADPSAADLVPLLHDYITATVQFGIDEVQDVYERLGETVKPAPMLSIEDQLWAGSHRRLIRRGPPPSG